MKAPVPSSPSYPLPVIESPSPPEKPPPDVFPCGDEVSPCGVEPSKPSELVTACELVVEPSVPLSEELDVSFFAQPVVRINAQARNAAAILDFNFIIFSILKKLKINPI